MMLVNARDDLYEDLKSEYFVTSARPNGTYKEIFDIFFTPTPILWREIRVAMEELGI